MKKNILVICAIAAAAVLSGCQTASLNENHSFQGKVWRAEVHARMSANMLVVDDENLREDIAQFIKRTGWSKEIVQGMRYAPVRFRSTDWGGTWHFVRVAIPDSMKTEDVQKGAIVDVMMERSLDFDYPSYRINRIIKVVCKASEKDCIERVKNEKSLNTVVDANPVPGNHYGNTYKYKLTMAEAEEFNKSLKK